MKKIYLAKEVGEGGIVHHGGSKHDIVYIAEIPLIYIYLKIKTNKVANFSSQEKLHYKIS